jgi:homoserine kinase
MDVAAGLDIRVAGSTSNLGPGFDALGLALQVYLRVRVAGLDGSRGRTTWTFLGQAPDGDNLIEVAMRSALGGQLDWPSMRLEVETDIPMKAGLGSSAAAIVAGLQLAAALGAPADTQSLLDAATGLEGHPDNVSASILGGLTVSCQAAGHVVSRRVDWPPHWRLVVATPELTLSTKVARAALPSSVPLSDAVANLQRSALLVHAVATADRDLVREALRDRLHQPHRARLVPGLERALAFEAPGLLGAFLSGAGPSIAAIVDDEGVGARDSFTSMYRALGLDARVRVLQVHQPRTPLR